MAIGKPLQVFHVFRYRVHIGETYVPSESLEWDDAAFRWERSTLVMTRALLADRPELYEELADLLMLPSAPGGRKLRVSLETREHYDAVGRVEQPPTGSLIEWELDYDKIVNRGFDFVHAAKDEIAREAVAFVGARMTRVKR